MSGYWIVPSTVGCLSLLTGALLMWFLGRFKVALVFSVVIISFRVCSIKAGYKMSVEEMVREELLMEGLK